MIKLYVIGSLRNERVPQLAHDIRTRHGIEVFDDWYGAGNEADDKWQAYENGRQRGYANALKGHAAQHVFNFDRKHILESDAVMLVLPAGKSGHLELGWAAGRGKISVILLEGEPERFDVMYNFADLVTNDVEEAVAFIKKQHGDGATRQRHALSTMLAASFVDNVRRDLALFDGMITAGMERPDHPTTPPPNPKRI